MRVVLLFLASVCFLPNLATAQLPDVVSARVPSQLPIFVNGQRLDTRHGAHDISLSRHAGLLVDGVLYMPVQYFPRYVPGVRSDGMYYVCDGAWQAAGAAFDSTQDRAAAKQAMLDFWRREFGDSLIVTARGEWDFEIRLRTESPPVPVWLSLACFDGYHPECQLTDNFAAVEALYRELQELLTGGFLVLCGQGYVHSILPGDAVQVIKEIKTLQRNPPPHLMAGDQLVYRSADLMGGKYGLGPSEVADLVGYR